MSRRGALLGVAAILAILFTAAIIYLRSGDGNLFAPKNSDTASSHPSQCKTGEDANKYLDCDVVADVNSLQAYWSDVFLRSGQSFHPPRVVLYSTYAKTGCGDETSAVGPFYCQPDEAIYLDLSFMSDLQNRFGAQSGPLARAYVVAHEYGHHVQNLLGTSAAVSTLDSDSGPTSAAVRKELQADCYAGIWTNHAASTMVNGEWFIAQPSESDIAAVIDTTERLGDDYVQQRILGRSNNPAAYRHGTSTQRAKWYRVGLSNGDPSMCDTFARGVDLG
jgi:predicted metalloprotease